MMKIPEPKKNSRFGEATYSFNGLYGLPGFTLLSSWQETTDEEVIVSFTALKCIQDRIHLGGT